MFNLYLIYINANIKEKALTNKKKIKILKKIKIIKK